MTETPGGPSPARFCRSCGTAFAGDVQFCTQCGTRREMDQAAPESSGNPFLEAQQKSPGLSRRTKAILASVAAAVVLLGGGYGIYWSIALRYNLEATTISELVLDRDSRVEKLVAGSCATLDATLSEIDETVSSMNAVLKLDYTAGLDESANVASLATSRLNSWAEENLQLQLGETYSELSSPDALARDLLRIAPTQCDLGVTPSDVLASAEDADDTIRSINNPPSNWEGNDYFRSDEDPNIAWRWASSSSYSCGYYEGCWKVYVKVHRTCPYSVNMQFDMMAYQGGSVWDSEYETLYDVRKGRTYSVMIYNDSSLIEWGRVETLSCD